MNIEQTIIDNQKMIYKAAGYFNKYQDKEDLIQEGNLGFIKAIRNYDGNKGAKVTTYAYGYITGEMKRYAREDKGIKISRDITKLNLKIEKARIKLCQKLMREPSIKELSDYLEIPEYNIAESLRAVNLLESIDDKIGNDEGKELTLHDVIPEKTAVDIDTLISLKTELERLQPFERKLIEKRYLQDLTQSEVSDVLGLSQVQVSRYEQKILHKLKDRLAA